MIPRTWINEIANEVNLPYLSQSVYHKISNEVEEDLKRVIMMSLKLQKRCKKRTLSVEDVNMALTILKTDKVYGLSQSRPERDQLPPQLASGFNKNESSVSEVSSTEKTTFDKINIVDLANFSCRQLPQYPVVPEIRFHWLAICGVQPNIPENPDVLVYDAAADTTGLPREMSYFYTKLTRLVLSVSSSVVNIQRVQEMCELLKRDRGLQGLETYLCRFIYLQIRRHLKSVPILQAILVVVEALVSNPHMKLENCLHQILPSVLSCIVGAKIGIVTNEYATSFPIHFPVGRGCVRSELTPFHVRNLGACVIQDIIARYGDDFPDLLPRVCKTYLQAVCGKESHFATKNTASSISSVRYGGLVGLGMLGERVIRDILLPNINIILDAEFTERSIGDNCDEILLVAILGWYVRKSMKGPHSMKHLSSDKLKQSISSLDEWNSFIERNAENFVPHYVANSAMLGYCADLII